MKAAIKKAILWVIHGNEENKPPPAEQWLLILTGAIVGAIVTACVMLSPFGGKL